MTLPQIRDLSLPQLAKSLSEMGEPKFRYPQIAGWLYGKRVSGFDNMTNLSKALREKLSSTFSCSKMVAEYILVSQKKDAIKFGFRALESDHIIESVVLLDRSRRTACLSSQIGCGLGCTFCATAKMGFVRNLTVAEITGQLIGINDYLAENVGEFVGNIVFMGMGEALLNFENFRTAFDILMDENGFALGGRKITVSTAGLVPSIERLMAEDLNINLAISLNHYDDNKRSVIMPVNRKYPIHSLIDAARRYFASSGRRVTFEYVVVHGDNDTPEAVSVLSTMLRPITCKINLIPLNVGTGSGNSEAKYAQLDDFCQKLTDAGLSVTIRHSRGQDILGACGQLSSANAPKISE